MENTAAQTDGHSDACRSLFPGLWIRITDPDPYRAAFLNADPDIAAFLMRIRIHP